MYCIIGHEIGKRQIAERSPACEYFPSAPMSALHRVKFCFPLVLCVSAQEAAATRAVMEEQRISRGQGRRRLCNLSPSSPLYLHEESTVHSKCIIRITVNDNNSKCTTERSETGKGDAVSSNKVSPGGSRVREGETRERKGARQRRLNEETKLREKQNGKNARGN
jgi:hypothetical protein